MARTTRRPRRPLPSPPSGPPPERAHAALAPGGFLLLAVLWVVRDLRAGRDRTPPPWTPSTRRFALLAAALLPLQLTLLRFGGPQHGTGDQLGVLLTLARWAIVNAALDRGRPRATARPPATRRRRSRGEPDGVARRRSLLAPRSSLLAPRSSPLPAMTLLAPLFAHLDWADRRALAMLRALPTPPADAVRRFAHVLAAEEVWLARLEGRTPRQPVWPDLDLDACAALADANRAGYAACLAALTPESLAREVAYVNSAGDAFRTRAEDILLQVALHGQYHRGQIALLVRAAGGEPSGTDYISFVRGAPAATTPVR